VRRKLATHLRVPLEELPTVEGKEAFREYVETLRDRWQEEANAGLELIRRSI
jgi:hypothetical protein